MRMFVGLMLWGLVAALVGCAGAPVVLDVASPVGVRATTRVPVSRVISPAVNTCDPSDKIVNAALIDHAWDVAEALKTAWVVPLRLMIFSEINLDPDQSLRFKQALVELDFLKNRMCERAQCDPNHDSICTILQRRTDDLAPYRKLIPANLPPPAAE